MNTHQQGAPRATQDRAGVLRAAMVEQLQAMGVLHTGEVAAAFGVVPRDLFAPGEAVELAYETKRTLAPLRNDAGVAVSVISASHVQAMMLEAAQLRPGMRVLEIGSGGYQAALIAELVGPSGSVTTMDIDPQIVARARQQLPSAGYPQVSVVHGDAEYGATDGAPYDRILVTCGAWDIPPAWSEQLAPDGRIVVPLRMRGLTRTVTLHHDGPVLRGQGCQLSAYVPVRGAGEHGERALRLGEHAVLRAEETVPVDTAAILAAVHGPALHRWSRVLFDQVDSLDFFLGMAIPHVGLLHATPAAISGGVFGASTRLPVPTALRAGGSLAYRMKRPIEHTETTAGTGGTEEFETGVCAHGPDAAELAELYVELIRTWDRRHRHGPGPRFAVFPADTPDAALPAGARVLEKVHTRIAVSWS